VDDDAIPPLLVASRSQVEDGGELRFHVYSH
jgi:hypothetical protein